VKVKQKDDTIKEMVLEVKPHRQTQPPKPQKRITKQYITEVTTWGINEAKWAAARDFCADRKWEFKILDEYHLGIK
jgi:hypothetical protein